MKFEDFKKGQILRTDTDNFNKQELCIDNNNQDIKTEKFISDFDIKYKEWSDILIESNDILDHLILEPTIIKTNNHLNINVILSRNKRKKRKLITVKQLNS